MPHVVIIGGSDAGISAALRARELSPETEVTVLLEDRYPNFSVCGLPYLIGGEVSDWRSLAHRDSRELTDAGIQLHVFATALHHAMTVDAIMELDLSYAPPLGSPWDPAQLAAEAWLRARRSRH
jgi:hypothetical protein